MSALKELFHLGNNILNKTGILKTIFFILIAVYLSGCTETENKKEKVAPYYSIFANEIRAFDLHFDDSTKLIFSSGRAFDTSLVVVIRKVDTMVFGKIVFYPPTYYKDFPQPGDYGGVFLYKAATFNISNSKWNLLESKITSLRSSLKIRNDNLYNVIHPATFKLFYNDLLVSNYDFENSFFTQIHSLIDDFLLRRVFQSYPTVNGCIP